MTSCASAVKGRAEKASHKNCFIKEASVFCIDGREREMSLFLYLYPVRNESFAERQAHGTKQLNLSTDRQNLIVCGAMKNVLGGIDDGRKDSERCAGLEEATHTKSVLCDQAEGHGASFHGRIRRH